MMNNDITAAGWDTPRRVKRARIIAKRIYDEMNGHGYRDAMELGCGTGLISMNLVHAFEHITLMDSSRAMIDELKPKIASDTRYESVVFDIQADDYGQMFDCIYSSMVLHHLFDLETVNHRLYRMLRPGGKLCIVDLDKEDGRFHMMEEGFIGHNGFDHDELVRLLMKAGFKDIAIDTFYHGEKVIQEQSVIYSLFCLTGVKCI